MLKNNPFSFEHKSFNDYINEMRHLIVTKRRDLSDKTLDVILHANSPSEHIPKEPALNGIILVHGLLDSPCAMSSLFDYYKNKGFLVRSLLLPGHGTVPSDLLDIDFRTWLDVFNFAIADCRKRVKNLYVAGFSTGASLALYQSYLGLDVQGMILLAPAIALKSTLCAITPWHRTFRFLGEKGQWFTQLEETDYAKYHSITINSIAQVYLLSKEMKKNLQQPCKIPFFMVLSDDDESIDSQAAEHFFLQQKNPNNRLLMYLRDERFTLDDRVLNVTSFHPDERILDYSHISLAISPDHTHYGKHGDFQDFIHYQHWWGKLFQHKRQGPLHYGSFSWRNLSNYHLARLTYNPDFYSMMKKIDDFMEKTQRSALDPSD